MKIHRSRAALAVAMTASVFLVASFSGPAFAGTPKGGTGVFLVDYDEIDCVGSRPNTNDNVLDGYGGNTGVWVKSDALNANVGAYSLYYRLYDGNSNLIDNGLLLEWSNITCGTSYRLYYLEHTYPGPIGTATIKVTYTVSGKAFGNDSARFI